MRQPSMKTFRGLLEASLVTLFATLLAAPATPGGLLRNSTPKDPERPTYAIPAERKQVQGDGMEVWESQLHNARLEVSESQQNADTASWTYKRARTRRYPRGDALKDLQNLAISTTTERDQAEKDFSDLVDQARRAGVPAGTLAPYMDLADEIHRLQAARESE